jgi:hypothetical protein
MVKLIKLEKHYKKKFQYETKKNKSGKLFAKVLGKDHKQRYDKTTIEDFYLYSNNSTTKEKITELENIATYHFKKQGFTDCKDSKSFPYNTTTRINDVVTELKSYNLTFKNNIDEFILCKINYVGDDKYSVIVRNDTI